MENNTGTEIVEAQQQVLVSSQYELSVQDLKARIEKVRQIRAEVMKEDVHFGKIPGCGKKPTLLKPGGEVLNMAFRLAPKFEHIVNKFPNDHLGVESICKLYNIHTNEFYGQGSGYCSTRESKYRFRNAERVCPHCGQNAIIKGKEEYGGGWLCYKAKGGCGAKFKDNDTKITDQPQGKVENSNPADEWNTVFKMADKRSYLAATLWATAASEDFTQDLEDIKGNQGAQTQPPGTTTTAQSKASSKKAPQNQSGGAEHPTVQATVARVKACKAIPELENVEAKHVWFVGNRWDVEEKSGLEQTIAQQKAAIIKKLKNKQASGKAPTRNKQETEFLEKAHDYLQKIKDLKSEEADIEVADVLLGCASPEELLDKMEIGGLITFTNQLIGIHRNRKKDSDVPV